MNKKVENYIIKTCEMHTNGEPVRIIENIEPPIQFPDNSSIAEKTQYMKDNYDFIRQMTIFEPRGHRDMFAVILTEPNPNGNSDFGLIFFNNESYLSMCGHITISVGRYVIEKKKITPTNPETEIKFDCVCGTIKVSVEWDGNKVGNTKFVNAPAYVKCFDYEVFVPELKAFVTCDIVFGGNYFGVVSDKQLGIDFDHNSLAEILDSGTFLLKSLRKKLNEHPIGDKNMDIISGLYVSNFEKTNDFTKVLCIFGTKCFDRSSCGSGTTALIACQYFKEIVKLKQQIRTRNPFVSDYCDFRGIPIEEVTLETSDGERKCVLVEITGRGNFIGENLLTFEEDDYLKLGFLL